MMTPQRLLGHRSAWFTPSPRTDVSTAYEYSPIEQNYSVNTLLSTLLQHATVVWVFLPLLAVGQWLVPSLRPTCDMGYSNWSLFLVGIVAVHHAVAEASAWSSVRGLITRPEKTIMHQLGVLRRRKLFLVLGLLETLDIYTDLMFPFIALSCDSVITKRWLESWALVPAIGKYVVSIFQHLHFWGFSGLGVLVICCGGLIGVVRLKRTTDHYAERGIEGVHEDTQTMYTPRSITRLTGEEFFNLARFSETALMPGLADLCQEMAEQRRWIFDPKQELNADGVLCKMTAKEANIFKGGAHDLAVAELRDEAARESVDIAQQVYFVILLLGRTLFGNALQLWLQATFFEMGFAELGHQAKIKILLGMCISAFHLFVRCFDACRRLGCYSVPLVAVNLFVLSWGVAKIYYAFHCPEHIWNLSSGCIDVSDIM